METRSQRQKILNSYEFVYDFDEASEAWKSNKKSMGNGTYLYICQKLTKTGKQCNKKCLSGKEYCKTHNKNNI